MDIANVTDINQLKAIAYDELKRLDIAQENIHKLNRRIEELSKQASAAPQTPEAETPEAQPEQ